MNENMPICVDKEEVLFENQHPYIVAKGRKRKRKKHWTRIICFLLVGACIFFLVKNFTSVKEYLDNFFQQVNSDIFSNSNTSNTNNDNLKDEDSILENETNHNFIDTCPSEFEFINETNTEIILDNEYAFSKAKELYEKYSYDAPIVLIVNFSPKEAFYDSGDFYSDTKNVCSLGNEITNKLNQSGINALHLFDTGDNSIYESKDIYKQKVLETLEAYPSITYIFDISRAIYFDNDMNMKNEWVLNNEIKYPTIQLLCGTSNGDVSLIQRKSCALAYELSNKANLNNVPFISRLIATNYSLSQNFNCITLRADIGSYASTYEDSLLSGILFADSIIDFLRN